MRVLVTGGSGFAGAAIAQSLAQAGFDIVATYRTSLGFAASLEGPRLRLIQIDLANRAALEGPFDAIVHAAATSIWSGISVDRMVEDNVIATRNLLEAAERAGCRGFVFLSSVSVHGEVSTAEVDESSPIVNPDAYGATKHLGELMLAERQVRLPGLALRLPGIVGPNAHRNWLSNAAARLKAGEPVKAFNLDAPYNNAVHISDLAKMIEHVLAQGWTGFDAIPLGAAGRSTSREVLNRLARAMNVALHIQEVPAPKAPFAISCKRAMERWGYAPMEIMALADRYGREVGVSDTID